MSIKTLKMLRTDLPRLSGRTIAMMPKTADPVYRTAEHAAWSKEIRRRANYTCEKCGETGGRLFADHIREIKDGGGWELSNGQALCGSCHTRKTNEARKKRARE